MLMVAAGSSLSGLNTVVISWACQPTLPAYLPEIRRLLAKEKVNFMFTSTGGAQAMLSASKRISTCHKSASLHTYNDAFYVLLNCERHQVFRRLRCRKCLRILTALTGQPVESEVGPTSRRS